MNMKVMKVDVDIMYEAKVDHEFVKVGMNNNLEPGMLLGGTYEDEMDMGIVCGWTYEGDTGYVLWLDI